ncbi:hypothetical protein [Pseudaestuariivita rosea]|uniref:hypothetical protein n=1 Tax=Pseudaestuariivita rosea TaxID=2763263 RepID=UPI001ABB37FC|nr:hypothetical protein [Pseudaestuariivita rosea]
MVLGIRFGYILICMGFPVVLEGDVLDTVQVGNAPITLEAEGPHCVLTAYGEKYDTELPAPCSFARRGQDAPVTVEAYMDVGDVILITGPEANAKDYELTESVSVSDQCSHVGRGIILFDETVEFTDFLVEPMGFCTFLAPDEKFYFGLINGQ